MSAPKTWSAGIADETWKVVICGRDLRLVEELLIQLSYYLTDAGHNLEKGLSLIREMSGAQIIDALEAHKRTSLISIQNAISKESK